MAALVPAIKECSNRKVMKTDTMSLILQGIFICLQLSMWPLSKTLSFMESLLSKILDLVWEENSKLRALPPESKSHDSLLL